MLQREGVKTRNRCPCFLPERGRACSLNRITTGAALQVEREGRLRWSAHPRGGAVCRDHAQYPAFALSTSEMAVCLWLFCILLFIITLTVHVCSYFQPLIVSLYSVVGGDVCPGASTAAKGARSQPILESAIIGISTASWSTLLRDGGPSSQPSPIGQGSSTPWPGRRPVPVLGLLGARLHSRR